MNKNNNNGFTLVEVIVSVLIVTLMLSSLLVSISITHKYSLESGFNSLVSALDAARYKSMSVNNSSIDVTIKRDSDCYYCIITVDDSIEEYKLHSSKYNVRINNYSILDNAKIVFDKATGVLKRVIVDGNEIGVEEGCYITADESDYDIIISKTTGRCVLE